MFPIPKKCYRIGKINEIIIHEIKTSESFTSISKQQKNLYLIAKGFIYSENFQSVIFLIILNQDIF
ncbi:hypothetical protein IW15_16470 [Chryseobacterium soli]|uniref:Uncharacterized protein n=1 Tax=Chryseobacterium soli TaxID=445961 RepID=A0A086A3S4_9FLAO|nr:hypothetical protein IW15_16470 [Chryseobacterium soli]